MEVKKQVSLRLVGLDGNAFALLGAFRQAARKAKWTAEEIDAVMNDAKSGDYNHLVATLSSHCKKGGF
jgi:hypothetical protein